MSSTREALERAHQEMRRADHLIYVSLKYTRTVDVLRNIIERLIATIDASLDALLLDAVAEKKLPAMPTFPRLKIEALKKLYADHPQLSHYLNFYLLLRKLEKARFGRAQEYRRHVTMRAALDERSIEITIDIISDYFRKTKEFLRLAEQLIEEEE